MPFFSQTMAVSQYMFLSILLFSPYRETSLVISTVPFESSQEHMDTPVVFLSARLKPTMHRLVTHVDLAGKYPEMHFMLLSNATAASVICLIQNCLSR